MDRGSTMFLRLVVGVLGLMAAALCIYLLPAGIMSDNTGDYRPILLGIYLPAIPFFVALAQASKILGYIDREKVFTNLSVRALRNIKYCAFAISGLFAAGMPYVYYVADKDDAPGIILIGLVIIGAAFVVAVSAAVFQRLLQAAVDIKSENDLTV